MVKISFYQIRILNFQIHSSKVLSIGFPLPDFENMNMKKWMWSEQQRPLRLPLLQFLIQSAQVISFSSYSISNHFSPNLLYSTLLWMQCKQKGPESRADCEIRRIVALLWSILPLLVQVQLQLQLFHCFITLHYIHISGIWFNFFSQITLTMNLQLRFNYAVFMNWNFNCITTLFIHCFIALIICFKLSITPLHYDCIHSWGLCSIFPQITLHINLHLWFNYSIFMNWNI